MGKASPNPRPPKSETLPDQTVSLVVCGNCERPLFVDVHPRNSCGCPGRGERVEYVPMVKLERVAAERDRLVDLLRTAVGCEEDACDGPTGRPMCQPCIQFARDNISGWGQ